MARMDYEYPTAGADSSRFRIPLQHVTRWQHSAEDRVPHIQAEGQGS